MPTPPNHTDEPAESVPPDHIRHDWNSAGAWAGRLAFPMLVGGILLGMRAAQALRPPDRDAPTGYLMLAGCVACIAAGLWMLRLRHRHLRKIARGPDV